jgi:hypothetical protein
MTMTRSHYDPAGASQVDFKKQPINGGSMEDERRNYPRLEADMKLSLVFDNREVLVNVRNLCGGGVLVQVEKEDMERVTPSDVGRVAKFQLRSGSALEPSQATILRCSEKEGTKYVALKFDSDET